MINVKQELKGIGFGLIYILIFISFIYYFKLSMLQIYGLVILISVGTTIYQKDTIMNFIKGVFYISLIFGIIYLFGGYGIIGYLGTSIIIALFILYKRKEKYIAVKHHMESMIWGQPLYKFKEQNKNPPKLKLKL